MPLPIYTYDTLESTNIKAKAHIREHPDSLNTGFVIWAQSQTHGRGSHQRHWHSEPGGLYLSLGLKPSSFSLNTLPQLHSEIQDILISVTHTLTGITLEKKAPNDLLLSGKKVGGILLESSLSHKAPLPRYLIIGIGLNVNQREFPPTLPNAISISQITQTHYDLSLFIDPLTQHIPPLC